MHQYILKRLLLIIPTLIGIMTLNFFIVQVAPGGPVEQAIAKYQGIDSDATSRVTSGTNSEIKQGQITVVNIVVLRGLTPNILSL